jgi:hypothetical protein
LIFLQMNNVSLFINIKLILGRRYDILESSIGENNQPSFYFKERKGP